MSPSMSNAQTWIIYNIIQDNGIYIYIYVTEHVKCTNMDNI